MEQVHRGGGVNVAGGPEYDVLLFDLGGVLIDFAGFEEMSRLVPGSPDRAEIRSRWIDSEAVQRFERGDLATGEFARRVTEEFELPLSPEEFVEHFVAWARGPYPGAVELLRRVGRTHRVAALSNSNRLHTARHRHHVEEVIEVFYFSDEIGSVKPEREIFEYVIRDLGCPAHRIAFFDDTAINVEAARSVGLAAYTVDGFDELKAQLDRLGIIEEPI